MSADCGCVVTWVAPPLKSANDGPFIRYCPLHDAAGEMLAALEKARDWAQSDTYRSFPLSAVNTAISAATRAEPSATTLAPNQPGTS